MALHGTGAANTGRFVPARDSTRRDPPSFGVGAGAARCCHWRFLDVRPPSSPAKAREADTITLSATGTREMRRHWHFGKTMDDSETGGQR